MAITQRLQTRKHAGQDEILYTHKGKRDTDERETKMKTQQNKNTNNEKAWQVDHNAHHIGYLSDFPEKKRNTKDYTLKYALLCREIKTPY